MVVEALQDRLKVLEEEILRLTELASRSFDKIQQDTYWQLAQDLQREARKLRCEISRLSETTAADRR